MRFITVSTLRFAVVKGGLLFHKHSSGAAVYAVVR